MSGRFVPKITRDMVDTLGRAHPVCTKALIFICIMSVCMTYVYSILSMFMQNAWWTKQSYREKSLKNMKKKYALVMSPCAAPSIVKMRSLRSAGQNTNAAGLRTPAAAWSSTS